MKKRALCVIVIVCMLVMAIAPAVNAQVVPEEEDQNIVSADGIQTAKGALEHLSDVQAQSREAGVPPVIEEILGNIVYRIENIAYGYGSEAQLDGLMAAGALLAENPAGVTWDTIITLNNGGYLTQSGSKVPVRDSALSPAEAGKVTWKELSYAGMLGYGQIASPFARDGHIIIDLENTYCQPGQHVILWHGSNIDELVNLTGIPSGPEYRPGSAAELVGFLTGTDTIEIDGKKYFIGMRAGSTGTMLAKQLIDALNARTDEVTFQVLRPDGTPIGSSEQFVTGQILRGTNKNGKVTDAAIVVSGDVLGNGTLSISQLARLARALTGSEPLTGPYLLAGDINGSGALELTDLMLLARMLVAG